MPHSWNFQEWLDALGLRRDDQPEIIHAVQPVEVVGDHTAHTAPLIAPTALAGGQRTAIALGYSAIELTSKAPGGTFLERISIDAATLTLRCALNASPGVMANLVALTKFEMGITPTLSTPRLGSLAAEPVAGPGNWFLKSSNLITTIIDDVVYVPPGHTFQLWISQVNQVLNVGIRFRDCLAQPSQR